MTLRPLFELFFANITPDDLRASSRRDLSLRARNVVTVLRARRAPLQDLGRTLAELLAAWPRPTLVDLTSSAEIDWLDEGPRESLLKELLGEIAQQLLSPVTPGS